MDEQKKRIFLSYASERRELAADIAAALNVDGHEVFFDQASLDAGSAYDVRIRTEVPRSDLFIALISPEIFKEGSYVLTELKLAREAWPSPVGRVLPVMVERVDRRKLVSYLRRLTPLYPEGDVAAEVAAEAAEILRGSEPAFPAGVLRPEVAAQQLEVYRALWAMTGVLPKWARGESVTYAMLARLGRDLRVWYFGTAGGLFLTRRTYSRYAELQDALAATSREDANTAVTEQDYEEIRQLCSQLRRQMALDIGTRV
jgi:hypothetical protein